MCGALSFLALWDACYFIACVLSKNDDMNKADPCRRQKQKQNREWLARLANKTRVTEFSVLSDPSANKTAPPVLSRETPFLQKQNEYRLEKLATWSDLIGWKTFSLPTSSWKGHETVTNNLFLFIPRRTEWFDWMYNIHLCSHYHSVFVMRQGQNIGPSSTKQKTISVLFSFLSWARVGLNGKSFFRSQKDLRLIYLWASIALEIWLVMYISHKKWICGVTGDVFLVFPVKFLLHSLLICYCIMQNHVSEVKKTSNSFPYELQ